MCIIKQMLVLMSLKIKYLYICVCFIMPTLHKFRALGPALLWQRRKCDSFSISIPLWGAALDSDIYCKYEKTSRMGVVLLTGECQLRKGEDETLQ